MCVTPIGVGALVNDKQFKKKLVYAHYIDPKSTKENASVMYCDSGMETSPYSEHQN